MSKQLKTTCLRWMVILGILFCTTVCLARAGGGHGFGGGGHSFGGGGGFGGSHSTGIYSHSSGAPADPMVALGIVIFIVILAIIIITQKLRETQVSTTIRRGMSSIADANRQASLARLQAEDPGFDPVLFAARVRKAFAQIQQSWSEMKLEPIRPFVSDGVYERFLLQIAEMRHLDYRNVVEDLAIMDVEIFQVELDTHFQCISVRISAAARDFDLSLSTGKTVRPDEGQQAFAEIWTFIRRRGAKTQGNNPGLFEGHCPNCGAAVAMNQHAKCQQCGAILRSGLYDWVLSEITQDGQWSPRQATQIPGVASLQQRDSGFNTQAMEDLASVAFYRKNASDRIGSINPLLKIARPAYLENYGKWVGVKPRPVFLQCAIGGVDLAGVFAENGSNTAIVQITWSGQRCQVRNTCELDRQEQTGINTLVMAFARSASATTNLDTCVSSAHCPNCGAPLQDDAATTCEFCQTVLNDGSRSWNLIGAYPSATPQAMDLIHRARSGSAPQAELSSGKTNLPPGPMPRGPALLAWAVATCCSDSILDNRERKILEQTARARGIPPETLQVMIDAALNQTLHPPAPQDREEALSWLGCMAESALADGAISPAEARLMQSLAQSSGITNQEVKTLINATRSRLYAQARDALRSN